MPYISLQANSSSGLKPLTLIIESNFGSPGERDVLQDALPWCSVYASGCNAAQRRTRCRAQTGERMSTVPWSPARRGFGVVVEIKP